jgi:DNA-binding NarL/FixJ family response regulator
MTTSSDCASGFLLNDATPADIIAAIRIVHSGEALLAPSVTRRLLDRFANSPQSAAMVPPPGLDLLTEREREVMALVVRGLSNSEIRRQLYLSEPTVKTHVGRILMKLGVRDRVQLVVLAYEHGLVERTPPSRSYRLACSAVLDWNCCCGCATEAATPHRT